MAEPVKKSTFRREYEDPVISTMKKSAEIPEYQQMMDYLMTRRQVPEIKTRYLGESVGGLFQYGGDLPARGVVSINSNNVDTLVHEVTHAAERQIGKQYSEEKYPMGYLWSGEGKNQFTDAYQKLTYQPNALREDPGKVPPQQLMNLINKDWTDKAARYRSTTSEARAFAMENVTNPELDPKSITRAPAHIDSTLATEFMILLDLAKRGMKDRPQSQGR